MGNGAAAAPAAAAPAAGERLVRCLAGEPVDRAAIDREIERARWMVREGRHVPGFGHLIPSNVPWANMRYAAERLREVCACAR